MAPMPQLPDRMTWQGKTGNQTLLGWAQLAEMNTTVDQGTLRAWPKTTQEPHSTTEAIDNPHKN